MSAGFTFDGQHSTALGLKVLAIRRSVLPGLRDSFEQIPGRPGAYVFPEEPGDRSVVVEAGLVGTSQPDLIGQERTIAEWLRTRTRERLVLDDDPSWWLNAIVVAPGEVDDSMDLGSFEIEFRCDPYVYALNESSPSAAMGASFTFASDYVPDVPPRIVIYSTGSLVNPSVTIGGETISYTGTIPSGDAVVFDSLDFWALLFGDGTEGLDVRNGAFDPSLGTPVLPVGDFPTITQGTNTVLTAASSGSGTVVVFWRPRRF